MAKLRLNVYYASPLPLFCPFFVRTVLLPLRTAHFSLRLLRARRGGCNGDVRSGMLLCFPALFFLLLFPRGKLCAVAMLLPFQGAIARGDFTQGVALGYVQAGLSARFFCRWVLPVWVAAMRRAGVCTNTPVPHKWGVLRHRALLSFLPTCRIVHRYSIGSRQCKTGWSMPACRIAGRDAAGWRRSQSGMGVCPRGQSRGNAIGWL